MDFRVKKIKEICEIKSGKRLPVGTNFSDDITQYKYIRARDIKDGKISLENVAYITKEVKEKINKYIINYGDIAITVVANIGDVGFCEKEVDGVNLTENAVRLTNFYGDVNSKYLSYYLSLDLMKKFMEGIAAGAAQAKLGIYKIEKIKVLLPEEKCQNKIVKCLEKYDDLIKNNNCRIKLLENMAEEIYKEWFVRFRFPEYEKAIFIDGIPKGWQYKKFNEIFKYIRGVSYSSEEIESDDGIDFVNLKNIQSYGGFRRDGLKKYNGKYKEEQKVKYHDLVMGVTDMTQERRTVGAVALIPKIEGVITMDLIKLVSEIDNTFWYCLFKYGYYSQMISQFGNGANVIHLRPESIKNQKILLPSKEIIDKFIKIINPIFDEIEELYLSIENLSLQRDLLLPRLMSGKIDLTEKEIV